MTDKSERFVLVSGATRGLGLAIARRLASDGYHVIATGRKLSDELSALIDENHAGEVQFVRLDLNDGASIHPFVRDLHAIHQGKLYGLVNNAAVAHSGVLGTLHDSEIRDSIEVNVTNTILLTKYALRGMLINRTGRIINVSSIVSFTGFNGLSVYAATKAAMIGFTKSLARELGRANITVNAIAPGYMETQMTSELSDNQLDSIRRRTPLGALPKVEEVVGAVSFLLSEDAKMITGTTITVDGGSSA